MQHCLPRPPHVGRPHQTAATPTHLPFILEVEYHPDNQGYIGSWTKEQHLEKMDDPNYQHLVFEVDHQLVGYAILQDVQHPDHSILLKRFAIQEKGKGYGRQAIEAIKNFVFQELQPNRLWLDVRAFNKRAESLYQKTGFRREGTFKKTSFMGDRYVDLHIYAILKEEYLKLS